LEVVDHDEKVDIGVAVGLAASHGPEEPGTVDIWPRRKPLAQSPNQLASQARESQHRAGG